MVAALKRRRTHQQLAAWYQRRISYRYVALHKTPRIPSCWSTAERMSRPHQTVGYCAPRTWLLALAGRSTMDQLARPPTGTSHQWHCKYDEIVDTHTSIRSIQLSNQNIWINVYSRFRDMHTKQTIAWHRNCNSTAHWLGYHARASCQDWLEQVRTAQQHSHRCLSFHPMAQCVVR